MREFSVLVLQVVEGVLVRDMLIGPGTIKRWDGDRKGLEIEKVDWIPKGIDKLSYAWPVDNLLLLENASSTNR